MKKIRVLVCDDHEVLRKGIIQLISLRPNFTVVGEASDGIDAIDLFERANPDIILMDVQMPRMNGIEATEKIRKKNNEVKIIMLTVSDEEEDIFGAIKGGANGYLFKNTNLENLFTCLESAYKGEPQFSCGIANRILQQFSYMFNILQKKREDYNLSQREKEVLQLVAKGKTNQFIADQLFISMHTVKKHLQNILTKLHVNNRAEAAALATKENIIDEKP